MSSKDLSNWFAGHKDTKSLLLPLPPRLIVKLQLMIPRLVR